MNNKYFDNVIFPVLMGISIIEPDLKPYTRTGFWLDTESYDDAYLSTSTIKMVAESLPYVSNYVTENERIYSINAALATLYT
jgi:hypothetical protein